MAHEGRLEGVPSGRRTGRARDGARHERQPLGLQRAVAGTDDRVRRRRQGAHLRHQQAARAHDDPLARDPAAQRHGRCRRPDATAHPGRQDLRLRVRDEEVGHLHVSPARRRDGADGDGHDGFPGRASEEPGVHESRPRLRLPAQRLRHRAGFGNAEDHDDARLQPLGVEQPRSFRRSIRSWCARTIACGSASAT